MRLEMTPKTILILSEISKKVPDITFSGWSRNVDLKFRDGFVYAFGRNTKDNPALCAKKQDQNAEVLIYPTILGEKNAKRQLIEFINSMDVGFYLHMEEDPDLEKALLGTEIRHTNYF